MRPPRPWPSWRLAMSALIASGSSSSPAGRPSTMQVRRGPWDPPAVIRRSDTPKSLGGRRVRPGARGGLRLEVGPRDARGLGDDGLVGLLGQLVQPPGLRVVAVTQRPVAGDPGAQDHAALRRDGSPGPLGLLGVRRRGLADLEDVELVLLARSVLADHAILAGYVEELGLALADVDGLAGGARRPAGAVALGDDAGVEHEHRGLLVVEHTQVDQHWLVVG